MLRATPLLLVVLLSAPTPAVTFEPTAYLNDYGASDNGTLSFDYGVAIAEHDGTWVAVWQADQLPGTGPELDSDIAFARSFDGGASWSPAGILNSQAGSDTEDDGGPEIAGASGTWLAVWDRQEGPTAGDSEVWFSRSTNDGASWSPMQILNTTWATDGFARDGSPHVAGDGSGTWIVVWTGNNDLGGTIGVDDDVLYARSTDDGVTWSAPLALNSYAAGDSSDDGPDDFLYDNGVWAVIWETQEDVGGIGTDADVVISRSTDDGLSWSVPAPVNADATTDTGSDTLPHLAADEKGRWMALWLDNTPQPIGPPHNEASVSTSTDFGATWSATIQTGIPPARPVLAGSRGTWVIAIYRLHVDSIADYDIFQSQSTDGGQTWTAPAILQAEGDGLTDILPVITADDLGRFVLAWQGFDTPGPAGSEPDILYRRTGGVHVPALPFAAATTTALLVLAAAWRRLRPR